MHAGGTKPWETYVAGDRNIAGACTDRDCLPQGVERWHAPAAGVRAMRQVRANDTFPGEESDEGKGKRRRGEKEEGEIERRTLWSNHKTLSSKDNEKVYNTTRYTCGVQITKVQVSIVKHTT
ncbi:hypothetical protein KSP40_PGU017269 [Platanthera guangdongensis]|uniref:Uncharacterized protein n=1 Tax=Platanthera guangdongensis TaxID=2320717 RepID=A0ABR2N201_9ASPA